MGTPLPLPAAGFAICCVRSGICLLQGCHTGDDTSLLSIAGLSWLGCTLPMPSEGSSVGLGPGGALVVCHGFTLPPGKPEKAAPRGRGTACTSPVAIAGCQVRQAGTSPAPALGMGAVPRSSSGGNRDNLG